MNFAIIGANLPLARAVFVFFHERRSHPASYVTGDRNFQRTSNSDNTYPSKFSKSRQLSSSRKSQESVAPLELNLIRKTTDILVTEDRDIFLDGLGDLGSGLHENSMKSPV